VQNPPADALIAELNYRDNPWFPEVLEQERQRDLRTMDPQTYAHVWEGKYLENSEAQVLAGKYRVEQFEIPKRGWDGPYHGLDFGFANDPTAANRTWINGNKLMVELEASKVGLELDDTAEFVQKKIPGIERYVVRADSARPESISYLKRNGLPRIEGVRKWSGSVEDGIGHLRSYDEIIIHPRCEETIKEARLYSYQVDRHTGDVLPKIVDAHNHHMDAIRYALQPLIEGRAIDYRKIL
jgi:phage terminase large subunit